MKMLTKLSAVLGLISALASTTAMASLVQQVTASCGNGTRVSDATGYAECNKDGSSRFTTGTDTFNWNIRSIAQSGYESGGLRTRGLVEFTGLLQGGVGANASQGSWAAGTAAVEQIRDQLTFNFADAFVGSTLTMKTKMLFHGVYREFVDETKFIDNKVASMRAEFSASGFGVPEVNQMGAFVNIRDGGITTLGSPDITNTFTNSFVTVNPDGKYSTYVGLNLDTHIQLFNGIVDGSTGIGDGKLDADFSSTAGVVSIDFFDQQGQRVDYTMTSSEGLFAFLQAAPTDPVNSVPEPGSNALVLLGLCAVAGFSQRRRSVPAA